MKALVTGSAGFIGSHLVDALTARGYRVTGVDRQPGFHGPAYRHVSLDLAEDPTTTRLADVVDGADVVFHLAARPGVRGGGPAIEEMRRRDNVLATRHLLSVVPPSTPMVATSSSSVYGGCRVGTGSREDDPLQPLGGYARSKVAMERVCEDRRASGGVIGVVRPFTVAGEGQRHDMAFSIWLDAIRRGEPIRIFGSEERSRDITDIRHAVEGLIRAGERGINETVNIGTGVSHRLVDMARALIDVAGFDADLVRQPATADEVPVTRADTTRCRRLLGFVPEIDLHSLLARQLQASLPLPAMAAT